jgi:myosin heavy chain 6/7
MPSSAFNRQSPLSHHFRHVSSIIVPTALGPNADTAHPSSRRYDLDEIDDITEWGETNEAFKVYGMSEEEIKEVWRVVASVLTFGQLEFADGPGDSHQATLTNDAAAQKAASLFGINAAALTKSLTKPRIKAGTETVQRAQSKEQVDLAVKALAKSIYEKLFLWIVQRINNSLDQCRGRGSKVSASFSPS